LQHRHICRMRAFENLSDVFSSLTVHPADARAIAQETAHIGELLYEIHSRDLVAVRERDNLLAPIEEDRIGRRDESVRPSRSETVRRLR